MKNSYDFVSSKDGQSGQIRCDGRVVLKNELGVFWLYP